jgi:acetoin utilization protein AcuC
MVQSTVVWDPALLSYDFGPGHPFNPARLALTIRLAAQLGVLDDVPLQTAQPATDELLEIFHDPAYLMAVKDAPTYGADIGRGLGSDDNPIFARMHEAGAVLVGSTVAAAACIASNATSRAVNIAGGLHHAMPSHASGFCVYNDVAVAIKWLLEQGFERIAYVDSDVHHGDGVQAAFYADPRVLTISVHQHPATLFPGTGYATEIGIGKAAGTAVNVALPPETTDGPWLRAFQATVPSLLERFQPQILVSQCGVDSHREDPLANLSTTVDGHARLYALLRQWSVDYAQGRWLAVGGGGYELARVVPRSWTHLMATVLDRDVDPTTPIPAAWLDMVAKAVRMPLPEFMTDKQGTGIEVPEAELMVVEDVRTEWYPDSDDPVDRAILTTRRAVFPLHGLDPDDPRD